MRITKLSVFLGTLAGALSLSLPAHAGPMLLVGLAVGVVVGAAAVGAAVMAASAVTAPSVQAVAPPSAPTVLNDGPQGEFDAPPVEEAPPAEVATVENTGILIDKQGTLEHIPIVYGTRMMSGTRVFVNTNGENNKYLYLCIVLCEGEIDSIGEVFLDDVISTDPMFAGRVEIQKFVGTETQGASSLLLEAPGWTGDHRLVGLAYLAVRLEWKQIESEEDSRQNPFTGIPRIKCIVKGRKVPDATVAGGVTYGGETFRYSENPADQLLDYIRNPRFGKGLENERIDFASFSTAAQKFDQTVTYHLSGSTGKMMTSNAVIDTRKTIMSNVKIFLNNCRSGMPYVQGKFKLKLLDTGNGTDSQNTTVTSVFDITENELVDSINIEGTSTRNQYNQILITHPNPGSNWEMSEVTYPVPDSQEDTDLLNEDGGRRLQKTLAMPHITEPALAGDLAHIILMRSRGKKTITFKTTAECHEVEVGDIVTITYSPLGFSSAKYRIQSMKVEADYSISFQAVEHEPTDYVFKKSNFVSVAPKVFYAPVIDSPATTTFLQEQAAVQAPYVPTVYVSPSINNNGIIRTSASVPSNLTATGIAANFSEETFRFNWTAPADTFQYHSIAVFMRADWRGETVFSNLKNFLDASITTFTETFGTGPRTYTIRIFYKTWTGQYSNPLEVRFTTVTRYGTQSDYVSGVNVFNGTVVNI